MKLIASDYKAKITWIRTYHQVSGGVVIGYDAKCSCGWETNFGGGLKSAISEEVWQHKYFIHDYKIGA